MDTIASRLASVQQRIAAACAAHGRAPGAVALLAVAKTFGADAVCEAVQAGQRAFGENYIQEGVDKMAEVSRRLAAQGIDSAALQWHCIGPIQSNKTRLVAEHFAWAHSIDRLKIAQRLSEQRPEALPALQVCLQVNIDGGANKAGLAPDAVAALAQQVQALPRLRLRGLMTIPEPGDDYAAQLAVHQQAHALWQQLRAQGLPLDTLSMGMSADLEAAIGAGSTMLRVGSAIFGARPKPSTAA